MPVWRKEINHDYTSTLPGMGTVERLESLYVQMSKLRTGERNFFR